MSATHGRGKLHKDVITYGRRLLRDGWTRLDDDPRGNPRYAHPGSPAVLTLDRYARPGWRRDAARQVARITGARDHSARHTPSRLTPIRSDDSVAAELARVHNAHRHRYDEQRRQMLLASWRNLTSYQRLMQPGR